MNLIAAYFKGKQIGYFDRDTCEFVLFSNLQKLAPELFPFISVIAEAVRNSFPEEMRLDGFKALNVEDVLKYGVDSLPDKVRENMLQIDFSEAAPVFSEAPEIPEFFTVKADIKPEILDTRQNAGLYEKVSAFSGVQTKLGAVLDRQAAEPSVRLPRTNEKANVIIKPLLRKYLFIAENEYIFMSLAGKCGLCTAESFLVQDRNGFYHYAVKRFDIACGERTPFVELAALFCETDKYGISTEELFARAEHIAGFSMHDFALIYLFGFLIGNSDMHLKNFSIFGNGRLTPCYDMLSVKLATNSSHPDLALPLGGSCDVSEDVFFNFISKYITEKEIAEMRKNIAVKLPEIARRVFSLDSRIYKDFHFEFEDFKTGIMKIAEENQADTFGST